MDADLIDILDEFRNLKINYDIERFKLLSFQLENIIKEEGKAELVCHFCNRKYQFSKEELEEMKGSKENGK